MHCYGVLGVASRIYVVLPRIAGMAASASSVQRLRLPRRSNRMESVSIHEHHVEGRDSDSHHTRCNKVTASRIIPNSLKARASHSKQSPSDG